jgi:hypothetical protein
VRVNEDGKSSLTGGSEVLVGEDYWREYRVLRKLFMKLLLEHGLVRLHDFGGYLRS